MRLGRFGGGVKASCLVAKQAMEFPHVQASKYFVLANSTNLFHVLSHEIGKWTEPRE